MAKKKEDVNEEKEVEEVKEEETEEVEEEKPKKKEKKVVRRRKTKEKENPLIAAIRLTVESGKTEFGVRSGLFAFLSGKAKLFVVAENTPEEYMKKVREASEKSKIPVIVFPGSSMELGAVCGKPFPVSVLSIYDVGHSNIMDYAKK
ncbi:MAG: 50S ribosomal protein L30e [Candidatus Bilamarchaeaceae archaeon]